MHETSFERIVVKLLTDAVKELREIKHCVCRNVVQPKPATQILIIRIGDNQMPTNFSVQAGGAPAVVQFIPLPSGSVFATPLSFAPVADDSNVSIVPNPGDTTGTEFQITVPASDTAAGFNLSVSGPLGAGGASISGSQAWTIIPAVVVPPPATSIGQQQLS
jgi:hypothetical protein